MRPFLDGVPAAPEALGVLAGSSYGHFTVLPVEKGGVRGLSLHMFRLARNASVLFGRAVDEAAIREQVRTMLDGGEDPRMVRVNVYAPGTLPRQEADGAPHVLTTPQGAPGASGDAVRVQTVRNERFLPEVKHMATLPQVFLRRQARLRGYDDVLLLDSMDRVLEGSVWNVGFFAGRDVVWPVGPMLRGVVMQLIVERLTALGLNVVERVVTLSELPSFAGAFATDSQHGVRAIGAIDDVQYATDPELMHLLQSSYELAPPEAL